MKNDEVTLAALIKQINGMKQTGSNTLSKVFDLINKRLVFIEHTIGVDSIKESFELVYQTNMELIKNRNEAATKTFCAGILGGLIGTVLFMAVYNG